MVFRDEILLDTKDLIFYDVKSAESCKKFISKWKEYLEYLSVESYKSYIDELRNATLFDLKDKFDNFILKMKIILRGYLKHNETPEEIYDKWIKSIIPSKGFNGYYYYIRPVGYINYGQYSTIIEKGNEYMFPTLKEHISSIILNIDYHFDNDSFYHRPGN